MKHALLLAVVLLIALVTYGQLKTQPSRGKPVIAVSPSPQQTPRYDPTNPASWPDSLDAVVAAPQNHKVVLENDRVRVLEVTVRPGEKEPLHMHRLPSVMYVMAEDNIRDYDADGKLLYDSKTDKAPPKTPYTVWMEPQAPHLVENLSKKPLRLLRVELKQ
jgi:mannose-6-phosphate isomerase-like protein (cupin superfamily)